MKKSNFYVIAADIANCPQAQLIRFIGAIDKTNLSMVKKILSESVNPESVHLTVDFEKLSFISTSAITVIVFLSELILKRNGSLTLSNLSGNLVDLFEVSGIVRLFDIYSCSSYTAMLSLEKCREYLNIFAEKDTHLA